jgi:hypothetical protein
VFSLVVKHSYIKALFVMIALFDIDFEQLSVKITFLYDKMEEMIYIYRLEGFISQGNEDHMCLLKKLLYGLKQSSR